MGKLKNTKQNAEPEERLPESIDSAKPKPYFAIISGLCASTASLFGKLMGSEEYPRYTIFDFEIGFGNIWIYRGICVILMLCCNAFVWTTFVKALHTAGGSLRATVMSAATNYIFSFIYGAVLFDEKITYWTMVGLAFILAGLWLLSRGNPQSNIKTD